MSNGSLIGNVFLVFIWFPLFQSTMLFHSISVFSCSLIFRYIHRELVVKNVVTCLSLASFLEDWINDNSNHCVYTLMQLAKFPRVHLAACGWYLDCSCGFVPKAEEPLYSTLVSSSPQVIELEEGPEEDENPAPPTVVKEVGSVKGKGKGKRVASSQVSTRSFTKASLNPSATPGTTVVGSPTATSSALAPDHIPAPSP